MWNSLPTQGTAASTSTPPLPSASGLLLRDTAFSYSASETVLRILWGSASSRNLYGVVMAQGATGGVVVTTSYFSRPARVFQASVPHRLKLYDYVALKNWLHRWQQGSPPGRDDRART